MQSPWREASRFLFGRDFFISYSRRDAAAYAATLASRLSPKFSSYLDQLALPRGEKLPEPIRREVQRATVLVLVGSQGAVDSTYVRDELQLFLTTGRPVLLLDVDGALERAPWTSPPWSALVGVYRARESRDALQRAEPSQALLDYLRDSFTFTRQDRRLRFASGTAALLLATVPVATTLSVLASRRAAEATARATEARAEEARARASAEEQRRIAASRRLAGESGAQIRERPVLGLLLAATAHETYPSTEARRSLFSGLTQYPGLARVMGYPEVQHVTASADGRFFAAGSADAITVIEAATLKTRVRIAPPAGERFDSFALTPDASMLAGVLREHVILIDATTGHTLGRVPVRLADALSFIDGRRLAIGAGATLQIVDVSVPEQPTTKAHVVLDDGRQGQAEQVEAMTLHGSGRQLIVATTKRIVVCDPASGRVQRTLTDERDVGGMIRLAVPADADAPELVAAVNMTGRLVVWELTTGERLVSLSLVGGLGDRAMFQPGTSPGGDVFAVAFTHDGERLAAGSVRGRFVSATVEELTTWGVLQAAPAGMRDAEMALFGMSGALGLRQLVYAPGILGMVYAGTPQRLLLGQMDGAISVWDGAGESVIETVWPWPDGESQAGNPHAISADGQHVTYAWWKGGIFVAGMNAAAPPVTLAHAFDTRTGRGAVAIAPDGQVIAAIDSSKAGPWRTVALWDRRGALRSQWVLNDSVVPGIAPGKFCTHAMIAGPSPGRILTVGFDDGMVAAWDVADPSRPRLLGFVSVDGRPGAIAVNPAKIEVAIVTWKGTVSLWDPVGGSSSSVRILASDLKGGQAVSFSQDGGTLTAFAQEDVASQVVAWDMRSRDPRTSWTIGEREPLTLSLNGHSISSENIAISPDATTLAVADEETVALWDIGSRSLLAAFRLPQKAESLAFVADGDQLVAPHYDGVTRIDVSARRLVARVHDIAGRSLTPDEVRRFLGM